eukprot:TRINITY_DN2438_c0_g1_i2.p1 TRINITY_DN2438_c0_g1~~TRINITY_DN2438_c0_g1_i2.p1  ORF type:complete len:192 (+),score=24.97 TRINITY_DN2438_c0_g1_i2:761-1336(+)
MSPKSAFTFKLALLCVCYAGFLLGTVVTLYSTYVWGYHSLRQIYLGLAVGVLSHVTLTYVLSNISLRTFLRTAPTSTPTPTPTPTAPAAAARTNTRKGGNKISLVNLVKSRITGPQAQQLFLEELWPLTVLLGYVIVSSVICLVVTWGLPFGTWEYLLLGLVLPLICYTYIVPLNGQFAYRRDTRAGLHED